MSEFFVNRPSKEIKKEDHKEDNLKSIKDILNLDLGNGCIVFSPIFGNLRYLGNLQAKGLKFECIKSNEIVYFRENGTYADGGKVLLFPSENDTDWKHVQIRYPKNETEIIDAICATTKWSKEQITQLSKDSIYRYLQIVARYLDKLSGMISIDEMSKGKKWGIVPSLTLDVNTYEIIWKVSLLSTAYYHFGFYRKKAAEVFLDIMLEKIKIWSRLVYMIDYEQFRAKGDINFWKNICLIGK